MKIIQSFAKFDEGNPRLNKLMTPPKNGDNDHVKLLFYSFLLSYLTLKKYYGSVVMYCNQSSINDLIKYIPYDEVKIVENKNSMLFWSYYKIDIMKSMKTDFIHVDSDVFIFTDLFSPFIENKKYDNMVQNIIPEGYNYAKDYVKQYDKFVFENNIINPKTYDGRCHSCGVIGMRHTHKNGYIKFCEKIRSSFEEMGCTNAGFMGKVVEELASYLYSIKNGLKTFQILPYEDIIKYGSENKAADYHNYTHLYLDNKFKTKYVRLVRNKIIGEFPNAKKYIDEYEKKIMIETNLMNELI